MVTYAAYLLFTVRDCSIIRFLCFSKQKTRLFSFYVFLKCHVKKNFKTYEALSKFLSTHGSGYRYQTTTNTVTL